MLQLEDVGKTFRNGAHPLTVLDGVNLRLDPGRSMAVIGPSGSGKTTLLGLSAGLDMPTRGRVFLEGTGLHDLDEEARAVLRRDRTGFVFQTFRLIPSLTALENVMVPAELQGGRRIRARARALLAEVGLADRAGHYPSRMSGGERQRVALARAFINQPRLLFADEPTGNLDRETGTRVLDLLFALNRERGTTLMLVTHDEALLPRVNSIVRLEGGRMVSARG